MQFVKKELFPAELWQSEMNRRFYSRTVDIRNHMYTGAQGQAGGLLYEDSDATTKTRHAIDAISRSCREKLTMLTDITYSLQEETALQDLDKTLQDTINIFKLKVPSEHGLALENLKTIPKQALRPSSNVKLQQLSVHKSRKNRRRREKVNFSKEETEKLQGTKRAAPATLLVGRKDQAKRKKVVERNFKPLNATGKGQPDKRDGANAVPVNPIVVDSDTPEAEDWIHHNLNNKAVCLYDESRKRIQSGDWLADSEVSAAQEMLKNQFPSVDGLRDTSVVTGDPTTPCTSPFVQILNTGGHWVCMSNVYAAEKDSIDVYDSIFPTICQILKDTACRMLMSPTHSIKFVGHKVQKQVGRNDCGLFAIAFATSICFGKDPSAESFNQPQMRAHFLKCLESGKMSPFPVHGGKGSSS